jgi:hypothetical protein
MEMPSELAGVVCETMDDSGGWKLVFARELMTAGHQIDWSKIAQ